MREFTLVEFKCQEAINTHNNPIETLIAGTLLSEVSESHGLYSTPAVKVVRETEIEYSI